MYTEVFGRVSYLVARARGRKTNLSRALFTPLSIMEMEVEHSNKRDLQRIKEAKCCSPMMNILSDPIKNIIGLFIAEVLFRAVKETGPDARLFAYLDRSIHVLETTEKGIANFHLVFLLHLLYYLGIYPNADSYKDGTYFDMINGVFTYQMPMYSHYLNREESLVFSRLLRISFDNMALYSFSRRERVDIIHRILDYYRLHLPEFPEIKSLDVMQSLFD